MPVFLHKTPGNIVFMHQSQPQERSSEHSARPSTKGSASLEYCIISIPGNQKCLLLCLIKGGKTFDLECQANLAIFLLWPHSLWPAFHLTPMPEDFLARLQPSARHPVWFGPDLWKPYLQPATSPATTKGPGPWLTPCWTSRRDCKEQNPWACLTCARWLRSAAASSTCGVASCPHTWG